MVERKEHRPEGLKRPAATLAEKHGAVFLKALADHVHAATAFTLSESSFDGFDKARSVVFSHDEAI
jgi:hypothetical protein